jgi:O-antigen/teichoic acid export membrane protein
LAFVLPFFLTLVLFGRPILSIFGEEFGTGTTALVIVSVGMLVNAGTGICGGVIDMSGYSKLSFLNSLVSVIMILALDILLVPIWGVNGAAVTSAMSMAGVNIARLIQVYWLHRLWPYNVTFLKPIVAGAVALVVGLSSGRLMPADLNLLYLVINIAAVYVSFVGATLLLGLSEEDRVLLSRTRRRFAGALVRH